MAKDQKPNKKDNHQSGAGRQSGTAKKKPTYDSGRIGDYIDVNSETRGTGPRNPIKGIMIKKDK